MYKVKKKGVRLQFLGVDEILRKTLIQELVSPYHFDDRMPRARDEEGRSLFQKDAPSFLLAAGASFSSDPSESHSSFSAIWLP
jgi:hypothetical protein